MPRAGIEPATRGFSVLCSTNWAIWAYDTLKVWVAGAGFEPTTFGLWARRASRLLHPAILNYIRFMNKLFIKQMDGGGFEPPKQFAADLQSVPFGHSGIHPYGINHKPIEGLEPPTCWLQISCSANWAISALFNLKSNKWGLQGSNLWPSACKADALPAELRPHQTTQKGLEPSTSAVTGRRSNQLSHSAKIRYFWMHYTLKTEHWFIFLQNIVTNCDNFFPLQPWLSPRPISKCQLNTLLYLHLIPIYLVVFKGSY